MPKRKQGRTKYTDDMDAVRFGKALGVGVRATAVAVRDAADAAAAPNPHLNPSPNAVRPAAVLEPERAGSVGRQVARGVVEGRVAAAGIKMGGRRFGRALWGPAARAGGVLWYELTGTFFALFALAGCVEAWHRRMDFFGYSGAQHKAWFALAMTLAFGSFTISSFIKANRRARRP